jgi:hypothetical protein
MKVEEMRRAHVRASALFDASTIMASPVDLTSPPAISTPSSETSVHAVSSADSWWNGVVNGKCVHRPHGHVLYF